jgi:hypothetical protein
MPFFLFRIYLFKKKYHEKTNIKGGDSSNKKYDEKINE